MGEVRRNVGRGVGKCWERCEKNVLGCGGDEGRCREVLGEMWESVLGCGGCGKVLGEV